MKFYKIKSSAARAAKQAGLQKGEYDIIEKEGEGFGYIVKTEAIEAAMRLAEESEKSLEETMNFDAVDEYATPLATKTAIKRQSDIERPTKAVWHIADEMYDSAVAKGEEPPKRKVVIQRCVESGIAFYTARTQYQQWLTAKKASV